MKLTNYQKNIKRLFDIAFSILALTFLGFFILLFVLIATVVFKENGIFKQNRVGYKAKLFTIYKIKSIGLKGKNEKTKYGTFLRKYKIDELPQFFNVLIGDMSIVGPRPDIKGFADRLSGDDRIILNVKPGITGPASILFRNEEVLLNTTRHPEAYNKTVIWPQKVKVNKSYVINYSFTKDLYYIYRSIL